MAINIETKKEENEMEKMSVKQLKEYFFE